MSCNQFHAVVRLQLLDCFLFEFFQLSDFQCRFQFFLFLLLFLLFAGFPLLFDFFLHVVLEQKQRFSALQHLLLLKTSFLLFGWFLLDLRNLGFRGFLTLRFRR